MNFTLFISITVLAQKSPDAIRLLELEYMKQAWKVDCNQIETSFAVRVCLNLKFQKTDSIMNMKYGEYLLTIENDSIRNLIERYQSKWIERRRLQSEIYSSGYKSHSRAYH